MKNKEHTVQGIFVKSRLAALGLAGLLAFGIGAGARAETLSVEDMRALYKESEDAIRNPSKTLKIMQARLDDNYQMVAHATRTLGDAPPQTGDEKLNKAQVISDTMQNYNMIKITDYQQNIVDIKLSDDKKWGYVSQTAVMRGTVEVTITGSDKKGTSSYTDAEACVDTLALEGATLKVVHSECKVESRLTVPK